MACLYYFVGAGRSRNIEDSGISESPAVGFENQRITVLVRTFLVLFMNSTLGVVALYFSLFHGKAVRVKKFEIKTYPGMRLQLIN